MSIECNCKSNMTISELKDILSKYADDDKIFLTAGACEGMGYGEVYIVKSDKTHSELVMSYEE